MSADGRRLAALVVNWGTGEYAVRCVESLRARWTEEGRDPTGLDVVVVDNASPIDQEGHLREIEGLGARVIRSPENLGYAGGVNRAYRETSGGLDDVVAILNPDLHFVPGNLAALMGWLAEHPECGVVGPRATIDEGRVMNLPRNALPTLAEEARTFGAKVSRAACRAYARRRTERALEWWTAEEPLATDMLSGCCLFMRRGVAEELRAGGEGPMDPSFPLYYEDTDLFRRLRARGYTVVQHVGTTILHHWSRSSGVGAHFMGEPMRRYRKSRRRYYRKHYGPAGRVLVDALDRLAERWPARWSHRPLHEIEDIGELEEPVELQLPRRARFVLELAMFPDWLLAVGMFGEGDGWRCPEATWQWWFPERYFLRAVDLDTREVLGAWTFRKTSPGRTSPLSMAEAAAADGRGARQPGALREAAT